MSQKYLVVIADSPFENNSREQAILGKIGARVQRFNCSNESDVIEGAKEADVVVCDVSPMTRNVISNLRRLVGIVESGVGYDNIDLDAATERGIMVCNVPNFITCEVTDHAVALILALTRKLHQIIPSTRAAEWTWRKFRPIQGLDGKTAGIIGFGNIGRQVAKRLRAFEMDVIAYDPYVSSQAIERLGGKPATLEQLLASSDVVTIHVPLTKETRHLIGKAELALMKNSAILVNTARGSVIDQEALIDSLGKGQIRAAGLDVLAVEPPDPNDPILRLDNVIVTPHIGWYSEESSSRLQEYTALEAKRILSGEAPRNLVNPQARSKHTEDLQCGKRRERGSRTSRKDMAATHSSERHHW